MTDILALDIATTCGFAKGRVGEAPRCGSVSFGSVGASENSIFAKALRWLSAELEVDPPDLIMIERMLPPGAMRGRTARATRDRLAGLEGVVRAVAYCRGVYRIETAPVSAVRAHFIGDSHLKRHLAKREVMAQCRRLGWEVEDDNAADAAALWSFACGMIDPQTALKVSPLFGLRGVTAVHVRGRP